MGALDGHSDPAEDAGGISVPASLVIAPRRSTAGMRPTEAMHRRSNSIASSLTVADPRTPVTNSPSVVVHAGDDSGSSSGTSPRKKVKRSKSGTDNEAGGMWAKDIKALRTLFDVVWRVILVAMVQYGSMRLRVRPAIAAFCLTNGLVTGLLLLSNTTTRVIILFPSFVFATYLVNLMVISPLAAVSHSAVMLVETSICYTIVRLLWRDRAYRGAWTVRCVLVILGAAIVGSLAGAALGAELLVSMMQIDDIPFGTVFFHWFSQDVIGSLISLPLVLSIESWPTVKAFVKKNPGATILAAILMGLISLVELLSRHVDDFFEAFSGLTDSSLWLFTHIICFPLVVWTGLLLGRFGFTCSATVLSLSGSFSLLYLGDDAEDDVSRTQRVFHLQIFLMILLCSSLSLNVIKEEKDHALKVSLDSNSEKAAFIAFLCHELRNPLHAVVNLTEFILETELDPEQEQFCDAIKASGEYMSALINDVLDSGKFEAGKVKLELLPVDVVNLVQKMVLPIRETSKTRSIRFVSHIERIPRILEVDPTRLKQIISNLLSNAVKFTPEGGEISCNVSCSRNTESSNSKAYILRIDVADTGPGMSQKTQENLFKLYQQASVSTSREYGGTGLGLAICKQITDLMGGSITVNSEVGKGATFTVKIPVRDLSGSAKVSSELQSKSLDAGKAQKVESVIRFGYDLKDSVVRIEPAMVKVGRSDDVRINIPRSSSFDYRRGGELKSASLTLKSLSGSDNTSTVYGEDDEADSLSMTRTTDHLSSPLSATSDHGVPDLQGPSISDHDENRHLLAECNPVVQHSPVSKRFSISTRSSSLRRERHITPPVNSHADWVLHRQSLEMRHILIVDDSAINRKILTRFLISVPGIVTAEASNGREAVDAVLNKSSLNHFHIIFMDIQMPVLQGGEATRMLRENGCEVPIIAVTANSEKGQDFVKEYGFTAVAPKPLLKKDVLRYLEKEYMDSLLATATEVRAENDD